MCVCMCECCVTSYILQSEADWTLRCDTIKFVYIHIDVYRHISQAAKGRYMYIYIYTYIYIFVYMYVCICMYIYMCMYIYKYVCRYSQATNGSHLRAHSNRQSLFCFRLPSDTYTHTYTYIYIHIYMKRQPETGFQDMSRTHFVCIRVKVGLFKPFWKELGQLLSLKENFHNQITITSGKHFKECIWSLLNGPGWVQGSMFRKLFRLHSVQT